MKGSEILSIFSVPNYMLINVNHGLSQNNGYFIKGVRPKKILIPNGKIKKVLKPTYNTYFVLWKLRGGSLLDMSGLLRIRIIDTLLSSLELIANKLLFGTFLRRDAGLTIKNH